MPHNDVSSRAFRTVLSIAFCIFCCTAPATGSEIHRLAGDGDLEAVVTELRRRPELINVRDEVGRTPLHWACRSSHEGLVSALVAVGAEVNVVDSYGTTPLHSLAHRGLVDSMEILLAEGAAADVLNYDQKTPLHYAAAADQSGAVAALIVIGANLEIVDDYGRTALVLAARERGGPLTAKLLLESGADVGARDRNGDGALSLSAWRGKRQVVNILLAAGARVPSSETEARSLFEEAAAKGLVRLFAALLAADCDPGFTLSSGGSLVHAAAAGGSVEILRVLSDDGFDLDQQDRYGWTPLHYAARDDRSACARWLLTSGANSSIRNVAGQTPFNVAEHRTAESVIQVLRAAKANDKPPRFPRLDGPYLGQKPPTDIPKPFAIGVVSSVWGLHSSVSFSPRGDLAVWAPMIEIPGQIYSQGGIMLTRSIDGRWTSPRWAPFSDEVDGDVAFFAPDGTRVYFIATRAHPEEPGVTRERIWYAERRGDSWQPARPVDAAVNDLPQHWQFSVDRNHTLYFSSNLPTGRGGADIYRSLYVEGSWQEPTSLGPEINSDANESTPYIAPDARYLIFQREGDLWIAFGTTDHAWTDPLRLPPPINSNSRELCPIVTPDGKYLFFISNRDGNRHIWWVSARFIDRLKGKAFSNRADENDVAFDSLGEVRVRLEKTDLAVASFLRALEINPDNRNAATRYTSINGS